MIDFGPKTHFFEGFSPKPSTYNYPNSDAFNRGFASFSEKILGFRLKSPVMGARGGLSSRAEGSKNYDSPPPFFDQICQKSEPKMGGGMGGSIKAFRGLNSPLI